MSAEIVTLSDSMGTSRARIMPALGFNCFSFAVDLGGTAVEALWADPDFAGGEKRPTRSGIPILFPFAGRLRGTTYRYGGRQFVLERGDDFGNAIHGFVVRRPWRVVERSDSHVVGEFHASRDDRSILDHWPADFRIRVNYRVSPAVLRCEISIDNPDRSPLPCGLGLHGYYRLPLGAGGDPEQCLIRVPVGDRWQLVDLLPTGRREPTDMAARLSAGVACGETHLDDVFTGLGTMGGACTASVVDPVNRRTTTMQFDDRFPQCVLFNPPHREAICIEPYTTVPDAFQLAERGVPTGLLTIAPGDTWQSWFEIRLSQQPA
jgi:aldose 1-epimerase